MLENLTERLSRVVKQLRGQARLTEENIQDAMREVRLALLEADVALPVVKDFVARVRERALGEEVVGSLTPGQALIGIVHRELTALMGGAAEPLDLATQPPAVFLLAGLQGAGKTTTAAKLARHLREERKKKVLLVSADVYRPAAIDQLRLLAPQVGADFFPSTPEQKPVAIAEAALDWARRHYHDVVIVDTAGRLHTKVNLMEELKKIRRTAAKKIPGAPHEVLLILDATTGQNALNQARLFHEAIGVTGLILTKMDGTAKGGVALAVVHETGIPLKYIGVGEGMEDLRSFDAESFVEAILG